MYKNENKCEQNNKWINEKMKKFINEQINEWINELMKKLINEQVNKLTY